MMPRGQAPLEGVNPLRKIIKRMVFDALAETRTDLEPDAAERAETLASMRGRRIAGRRQGETPARTFAPAPHRACGHEGLRETAPRFPRGISQKDTATPIAPSVFGAGCQTRTDDLMLTRQLLYQLS